MTSIYYNDEVSPRNMRWQTNIYYQWYNHCRLVLWYFFYGTCRHEKLHWGVLNEVKYQYKTFYRTKIGSSEWYIITFAMDHEFPKPTSILLWSSIISRQYKCNFIGNKQDGNFKWKNTTHQHTILFYQGSYYP